MALRPFQKGVSVSTPQTPGRLKPFIPQPRQPQAPQIQQQSLVQQPQKPQGIDWGGIGRGALNIGKGILEAPLKIPMKATASVLQPFTGVTNIPFAGNTYQQDALENVQRAKMGGKNPYTAAAGSALQPLVDIGSLAYGGPAGGEAMTGGRALLQSLKTGGAMGAGFGLVGGLQQGGSAREVAGETLKNALIGAGSAGILHGLLSGAGKFISRDQIGAPKLKPVGTKLSTNKTPQLEYQSSVPEANLKNSSYKSIQPQAPENVNPLIQEASKYKTGGDYVASRDFTQKIIATDKIGKTTQVGMVGDFLQRPSMKQAFGELSDVPVYYDPKLKVDANFQVLANGERRIVLGKKGMSNTKVEESIAHESIHYLRDIKGREFNYDLPYKQRPQELTANAAYKISHTVPPEEAAKYNFKQVSQSQPLQEGGIIKGTERGHITNIANSPEVSQDMARAVRYSGDTIQTRHQEPLVKEAQKLIFNNVNEAERIAKTEISDRATIIGDELVKHYDTIAQKAKANGDMVTFNAAIDKAVETVKTSAPNLTEAGRAISAASRINKLSPEGIIKYVDKVVRDSGSELKLSNEKMFDFMRKAEGVNNILDPREKAFATFDLMDELSASLPKTTRDKVLEALNLPRALMATADVSFPLRQGLFAGTRHPIRLVKQIGQMFKYFASEKGYRNLKADILTDPNYHLMVEHKLPLTDISAGLTGREERFMSQLSEKIPVFKYLARASDRAYTGMANLMRRDLFNDFVKTGKEMGITDPKFLDDAAKFTGSATGRGTLPKFLENTQELLNGAFFSPRLIFSRFNLLNPIYYAKLHPVVRKEALKTLISFVGTGTAVLTLAKLNGAEVGNDWRSADFGKIKLGNTRYDVWGGFQQYARLIGQEWTGEKISTITGKQTTLGEGYNAPTRWSIAQDFIESKEAPLMSFISTISKGDQFGEKLNIPKEVIDRFIPMVISDLYDLYREKGLAGVPMALPGLFGVGSQTYGDQIPMLNKTPAGNPTVQFRSQPSLGETFLNKITGKSVSNVPQDQWGPLYQERINEQKRQVELDAAKQDVLNTGQPKYVGDTFIFLDNGIVKTKVITPTKRKPLESELKKSNLQPFYGN